MTLQKQGAFSFTHSSQADKPSMTAAQLKTAFDAQGNELKVTLNNLIDALEAITGTGGSEQIGSKAITDIAGSTVYAQLTSFRDKLKSVATGTSGADFVNSATITGVTGATIYAQLTSLKALIDAIYTKAQLDSGQLDNRYYTETELQAVAPGTSGARRVGSEPISGVTGGTVYAQLADLKAQINTTIDRFNTVTGHDHDGTSSKKVDHINLLNKGTNTHAQIDIHIASQSNPHNVTTTQIGAETPAGAQSKVDTHATLTSVHGATSTATPSRLMTRDAAGRSKVAAPSAIDDVARKDTVDAVQTNLDTHVGTGGSAHANVVTSGASGFMTGTDKAKLDGISSGAEVNQNAFAKVSVAGQSDVDADSKTDTLTLAGGTGITITTDPATDKVTFTATGVAVPGAHASAHITGGADVIPDAVAGGNSGLMSGADKTKLNNAAPLASPTFTGLVNTPRINTTNTSGRQVNAYQWADLSSNASGHALIANNAYTDGSSNWRYANTHASLGARGIRLSVVGGVEVFDTGAIATTADAIFTPVWVKLVTPESPAFTGTPTAPTASVGTNTNQIATAAFVKAALDALVDAAPGALDTLNELAAALGDDPNFATTVTNALAAKATSASPTFTGTATLPTTVMGRNQLQQPQLKDYSEVLTTNATTTGAVTLNISSGNVFDCTLTGDTTFTFSNPAPTGQACSFTLILRQDATARVVTYPASVMWNHGVIPDLSFVSKTIILTFLTVNGGTRWYGFLAGSSFTT